MEVRNPVVASVNGNSPGRFAVERYHDSATSAIVALVGVSSFAQPQATE